MNKDILKALKTQFPGCWFKAASEFDAGTHAFVWSGEGSYIDDLQAFDHNWWSYDPHEKRYTMGVHNDLHNFVTEHGYYWEPLDPGTYLLYKI